MYLSLIALGVLIAVIYMSHVVTWPSLSIPNPLNAKLSVNTKEVLDVYVEVLELNAMGNYTGALNTLKALGVTAAVRAVPVIGQLHEHEYMLTNYLNELGSIYREALDSLLAGNYSGAKSLAIEGLMVDGEASNELNEVLSIAGSIAPGGAGQVISSYQSIRQYLISLNETFLGILTSNYTRTELTVAVVPNTVVVGGPITVYGTLMTVNGTPIPNASVGIYVGSIYVGSAVTDAYGRYSLNFSMPQLYVDRVNISAVYNPPMGSDYLPSSALATVNVLFNRTLLMVNYTEDVLWGETINVSGYVSGPPDRLILISIDGLNMSITSMGNEFSASISTANMTPGNYSMLIYAPPTGPYAPASFTGPVVINYIAENITVGVGGMVIAGLPIIVRGFVSPWIGNTSLTLSFGGRVISLNLTSPNFTVSIPTSVLLSTGRHYIALTINSNPPVMGITYAYGVFVLNLIEVVIPIVIIVAIPILVKLGVIRMPTLNNAVVNNAQSLVNAVNVVIRRSQEVRALEREITNNVRRGKIEIASVREIVNALANAIYAVEDRTKVKFRSTNTLREYLALVQGKLGNDEYAVLADLVGLAEWALYSPYVPSNEDVRRAWQLAKRLTQ